MSEHFVIKAGAVFDGAVLHNGAAMRFGAGGLEEIGAAERIADGAPVVDLGDDLITPGFVDLQVNGGGGVMFNDAPSVQSVRRIAQAHWRMGTRRLLPTLISDSRQKTQAAIAAVAEAIAQQTPGIAGLHLEGPHLSAARKGAHDAAYIRPMEQEDLDILLRAARALPVLMLTIAPESVTPDQVRLLSDAGIVVSIGHSAAEFRTCLAYADAGARCVTHLFNAMSQMSSREPGLAGAALACGALSAGLIADGIHVHPDMMRIAWAAKRGPGKIFLVSDAMGVAGTDDTSFLLDGRLILRQDGRLTLEDGTLAGADLDLCTAVRVLVDQVDVPVGDALRAATKDPHDLITGAPYQLLGRRPAEFIRLSRGLVFSGAIEAPPHDVRTC